MALPHIAYLVMRLISMKTGWSVAYRPYMWTAIVIAATWWIVTLYGHFWGRFGYEVKQWEYTSNRVPASFDGYRIVQISDIHSAGWTGHEKDLQEIINAVNALQPDLICFTGDLADRLPGDYHSLRPYLKQLKAKDGVLSVLGNHDYSPYVYKEEEPRLRAARCVANFESDSLGWTVLENSNIKLHRNGDSIAILGCENHSIGIHKSIIRGRLWDAMDGTDGMFRILLTHDPAQWPAEVAGRQDIPITLSGHTHAMQLRIFGITPMVVIGDPCDGLYDHEGQKLYVNIGMGGSYQMRINAKPEITLLTLKHAQE